MAITLQQAKLGMADKVDQQIVDMFRRSALLLVLQLQEQEKQSKQAFEKQLDSVRFESLVRSAVENARGRNIKAISALLDLQTLQESENRQDAVKQAVEQLKKEASYLFDEETPPPYAWGTGAKDQHDHNAPDTLAGALKEKFERK